MEEEIYALLDGGVSFDVAWGPLEGAGLPRASIFQMAGVRDRYIDGLGLIQGRIQVDAFGKTYLAARDAANELQILLENHAGDMVKDCALEAKRSGFDRDVSVVHRVSLTFSITYRE